MIKWLLIVNILGRIALVTGYIISMSKGFLDEVEVIPTEDNDGKHKYEPSPN